MAAPLLMEHLDEDEVLKITRDGWVIVPGHLHALLGTRLPDGTLYIDYCDEVMDGIAFIAKEC